MNLPDPMVRVADLYDQFAVLQQEVGSRLLDRLEFKRREPATVLDLGCGTGVGAKELKDRFRKARVIGLDHSPAMLGRFKRRSRAFRKLQPICGDLAALPFRDGVADLVFANLAGLEIADMTPVFSEYQRVLSEDGLLMFSTLGPASLRDLSSEVGHEPIEAGFPPFHDLMAVGDQLLQVGFSGPVMDVESISLTYPDAQSMVQELENTGVSDLAADWAQWKQHVLQGKWVNRKGIRFEIVTGLAFAKSGIVGYD